MIAGNGPSYIVLVRVLNLLVRVNGILSSHSRQIPLIANRQSRCKVEVLFMPHQWANYAEEEVM